MSKQAFVDAMNNPGNDERPVGTQTDTVTENSENDYENVGKNTTSKNDMFIFRRYKCIAG